MSQTEEYTEYTASEARKQFSDVFNSAHYGKPVVVTKNGKSVAVVSLGLLERLTELEALIDNKEADAALAEFRSLGGRDMEDVLSELDLD